MNDEKLIRKTVQLARKGRGKVSPNPMVGAVIVKEGRIIATGYHRKYGDRHAEMVAIAAASGHDLAGATLYVNLEPCCHHGKQPPCTDAIIAAGLSRVVVGMVDPNPLVSGQGIARLQEAGIPVTVGVLEEESLELNRVFVKNIRTGLPFVRMKIAQTLDGRINGADGRSKWITSEPARKIVHRMRADVDAVIVGIGTVIEDDPRLDVRSVKGKNPLRVVLDTKLRIPLEAGLLNDEGATGTVIVTSDSSDARKSENIRTKGARVWRLPITDNGRTAITGLLKKLAENRITSVLVEGGAAVFSEFLKRRQVDEIVIFYAPKILGDGLTALNNLGISGLDECIHLRYVKHRMVGPDLMLTGRPE